MATTPWKTSTDIISACKRRISIPIAQDSITNQDILDFANEVMFDSQISSVMVLHEEFYVFRNYVTLVGNQTRYPIPNRAIGMKLRDLFYVDTNNNLYEMSRVNPDNKDMYQSTVVGQTNNLIFYVENNDIVLTATQSAPTGQLLMLFYLRPNQLVFNERAFIISQFGLPIVVDNTMLVAGNTVTIGSEVFTAVSSGATSNQFNIGASSILSATNLVNAINANATYSASNATPATSTVNVYFNLRTTSFSTTNPVALNISTNLQLISSSGVPSNITNGSTIDFLQTNPGHKIYAYNIQLGTNALSTNTISVNQDDVPDDLIIGDYVASVYECIIPQLPPELHSILIERTCERILSAQGDMEMLGQVQSKIGMLEKSQGNMVDNRVEGAPQKIVNRNSLLGVGNFRTRRVW